MSKIVILVLLLVAFSNQLVAAEERKVKVLAIDGGGIKGILPAVILKQLELSLQNLNSSARIAEYFDVVAGTSTGGLIAALLTAPDPQNKDRPLYSADDILQFYRQHGPSIFSEDPNCFHGLFCPKFNGTYLRNIAAEKLNETLVSQTTTNVVISSFDIKLLQPAIFSTLKVKEVPHLNVKLSDACIGTSAAPTQFPPYYFKYQNTEFNLVDGLFIAPTPARLAVGEVLRQEEYENRDIFLVSIGTGSVNTTTAGFDANRNWNLTDWNNSIATMYLAANSVMDEYYINSTFKVHPQDYLRIQEYNLDTNIRADNASEENMDKLEEAGNNLLKEPVKRMNVDTFVPEETGEGTNTEALERVAQIVYEDKLGRLGKRAPKLKRGFFSLSANY